MTEENKVAIGCLSCYNDGRLTYKRMNADEVEAAWKGDGLAETVCDQPRTIYHNPEEWEVQDYDGPISRLSLGGWPNIENLILMMRLMDDDPDKYVPACSAAVDHYGGSPTVEQVEEIAEMMYCVGDQSLEDYFMEQAYDNGDIKNGDYWESYINWEDYAREQMYHYIEFNYDGNTYLLPHH